MSSGFYEPSENRPHFIRDEVVYNLEFLRLHELADRIFKTLEFDGKKTFFGSNGSRFFWPGMVNIETRERTAMTEGVFRPHYFDLVAEFANVIDKPETLFYLDFPTMPSKADFAGLAQWYDYRRTAVFEIEGYQLPVHEFTFRKLRR